MPAFSAATMNARLQRRHSPPGSRHGDRPVSLRSFVAWPVACSVPPATRETAKGDEANERDDNPDPQAHEENHHDSDDHDDAADGYTADSTFWCRHLCLLLPAGSWDSNGGVPYAPLAS